MSWVPLRGFVSGRYSIRGKHIRLYLCTCVKYISLFCSRISLCTHSCAISACMYMILICTDVQCKYNYTRPCPHRLHTPMSLFIDCKRNTSLEEEICANPSTGALEIENQPANQWVLLQESWFWLQLALGPSREELSHVPVQRMCNVATLICQHCGSLRLHTHSFMGCW